MKHKKIVVIGASGKVGSQVSKKLVDLGHSPTLISRSSKGLEGLKDKARVLSFSMLDVARLREALQGAEIVLTMITSNHLAVDFLDEQRQQADAQIDAIKLSGIEEFLAKVNNGFEGGTASKSDVTNYVFTRLKNLLSESDIKAIQGACFDDKEALVSLGKSEKDLPESVRKAIREAYGLLEKDKKRAVKTSQELSTERVVENSEAA